MSSEPQHYIYGQGSEAEYLRLARQGARYEEDTRTTFQKAGIARGMRVLDVGCGIGEVSRIVLDFVGPNGRVVGIDMDPDALAFARKHVPTTSAEFRLSTIDDFTDTSNFDAVVGRYILMHLKDPAAALRKLASHVRSDGIICFIEPWHGISLSYPRVEAFHSFMEEGFRAMRAAGAHLEMGARLYSDFLEAGLTAPQLHTPAAMAVGGDKAFFDLLLDSARSGIRANVPEAQRDSVLAQVEALGRAMHEEAEAKRATVLLMINIGAWSRKK
jgi:ubiquinone/menaquinone biosynthesis C-methylase UbiE